jgi:2-phosphoglycerate kinase
MNNFFKNKLLFHEKTKIDKIKYLILNKSYREAEKNYSNLRIIKEDNKSQIIILNYCEDRCNVEVKDGIIINIDGFY